jgi:hypothetical protein
MQKQLIYLIATFSLILSVGCRSIDYVGPNGENIHYGVIGSQELGDVEITLPGGTTLGFKKQKVDTSKTIDALTNLLEEIKTPL